MELKNNFRVTLLNQHEYVIQSEEETAEDFLDNLTYEHETFFPLKQNGSDAEPILVNTDAILSVQKVRDGGLSPNSRTYSVVE